MTRASLRAAALALSVVAGAVAAGAHGTAESNPPAAEADPLAGRFGGPFTLTDHTGRRVSDSDFRGKYLLVYFGFTHCVDACPIDLAIQHLALDAIGPAADLVQPLFITVDPARDTPDVLAAYLEGFHPSTIGLTGSESEIAGAAKAYRVHRRKVALDGPEAEHLRDTAGVYIVDHGTLTFLMGPDGQFLTLAPHTTTAERLAELLLSYLPHAH
ncbi:MAG TPA: SCO family protein [Methylomirabilota bacterium]|nr:SCO family protein [Methylomirabilota bacterium]